MNSILDYIHKIQEPEVSDRAIIWVQRTYRKFCIISIKLIRIINFSQFSLSNFLNNLIFMFHVWIRWYYFSTHHRISHASHRWILSIFRAKNFIENVYAIVSFQISFIRKKKNAAGKLIAIFKTSYQRLNVWNLNELCWVSFNAALFIFLRNCFGVRISTMISMTIVMCWRTLVRIHTDNFLVFTIVNAN